MTLITLLAAIVSLCPNASAAEPGAKGGIAVYVGCSKAEALLELSGNKSFLIHGLERDPASIATARKAVRAAGAYGRISVAAYDGGDLPYVQNTVNLLVVDPAYKIPEQEITRVLAPGGVAMVGGRRISKPVPSNTDDWSHFHQGPENNPVAQDTVVAPPRSLQWASGPRWLRSHEVPSGVTTMVTAGGRLFYTLDRGPIGVVDGRFPEKWVLIARDAYNGTLLWEKPLPKWGWQTWRSSLRSANMVNTVGLRTRTPGDYAYRMVASEDRLYLTLGNQAAVSIIDAATGAVLGTCKGTEGARKLLLSDGVLVVQASELMAFDAEDGKLLWKQKNVKGMAASDGRLVLGGVGCLDIKTGETVWQQEAKADQVMISDGIVLMIGGGKMQACSLADGKSMWSTSLESSKHSSLYIIGDTIWKGYRGERLSLKTGKKMPGLGVKNLWSPQHHHRCYSNKATSRFIIGAMEGMEFLDVQSDGHSRNNWVRGACKIGIMPANGMSYVPPDQCFCSAGVKLLGFTGLTGAKDLGAVAPAEKRLQKGPAYGQRLDGKTVKGDWPAFRHDALRSGTSGAAVPAKVKVSWQIDLDPSMTQPVAVGETLYIASRDTHTVYAIDKGTGKFKWNFVAEGRVDSPPTFYQGRLLFGSADGHVYCLLAETGELVWRFRAAPHQRLTQSFGQLESVWPVHGSVLMLDGLAYVSAGRSTYLDGGLFLYALDPKTGNVVHQHQEEGPYEDHKKDYGHSFWSEGARNDVLVSDGESIYIMQLRFRRDLKPNPAKTESLLGDRKLGRRMFSTAGFLDDEWYNRTFWMYSNIWPGFYLANQASKSGQLLVFDKDTTYGVKVFWTRNRHSPMFFPAKRGYLLFADDNDNEPILVGRDEAKAIEWLPEFNLTRGGNDKGKKFGPNLSAAPQLSDVNAYTYNKDKGLGFSRTKPPKWAVWVPIRVKAMVRTSDRLFVAGAPDVFDEKDPLGGFEGRQGALLQAVSAADGSEQAEYKLAAPPVLDGMIAAGSQLFIATRDGKLTCWQ